MKKYSIKSKLAFTLSVYTLISGSLSIAEVGDNQITSATSPGLFSRERWGASYSNYMNGPTFAESTGSSINHYLTLKHKFNDSWAVSGVFRPDSNFGNGEKPFTLDDSYLKLDYPAFYKNGDTKIYGDFRYHAPISQASKKAEIYGSVVPRVYASTEVGRLSLLYILIPKVYLNSKAVPEQKLFSHSHYISGSFKFSPFMSADLAMYPGWGYARGKAAAFNDLPAYPGFSMTFSPSLSLSPYLEIPLLNAEAKTSSAGGVLSYKFL